MVRYSKDCHDDLRRLQDSHHCLIHSHLSRLASFSVGTPIDWVILTLLSKQQAPSPAPDCLRYTTVKVAKLCFLQS